VPVQGRILPFFTFYNVSYASVGVTVIILSDASYLQMAAQLVIFKLYCKDHTV